MMADTPAQREAPVREHEWAAIEVEDLVVSYGRKRAVDVLSLTVRVGSVFGFLGPNGAGKTTTIKTLLGFRGPDGGSARVLGYDVVEESIEVRARVGFASEVAAEGRTVFFSTHLLSDIEAVADAVGIIKNGRLVVSGDLDRLREIHRVFRLTYVESPPEEEVRALRSLPGVLDAEREGRGVRLRARGEDVESVTLAVRERPYAVRDVDVHGLSLEDIFVGYIEEDRDGR